MADTSIASAVTLPDIEEPSANHAKGVKRRMSSSPGDDNELEQESKRQRMSPGKNSPAAARDEDATSNSMAPDTEPKDHPRDAREDRRKSSVADEKQRSKRLFGALLGSLNQPKDRTTKRRQEIESRRKAELKRQDDERVEDKQRRQERLREQRTKAQVRVEEEQMHIRHNNMLNRANYLQTVSEPKIFYKPWDLRPDEEDRIEEQIRDAQAQIDKELDEFDERQGRHSEPRNVRASPEAMGITGNGQTGSGAVVEDEVSQSDSKMAEDEGQTPDKSANEAAKPDEVPESPFDANTNALSPQRDEAVSVEPQKGKDDAMEDDGVHVEGGDEDSVIY